MILTLKSLINASKSTNNAIGTFYEEEKHTGNLVEQSKWKEMSYVCGKLNISNQYFAEGEFKYGHLDGEGHFADNEGNFFEGQIKKGLPHGAVHLKCANGSEYSG